MRQLGAYNGVDLDLFAEFRAWLDATESAAAPSDAQVTAYAAQPDHRVVAVERIDIQSQAVAQQFAEQVRQQPGSFGTVVQRGGGSSTTADYTARELQSLVPGADLTAGSILGPVRVNDGDYAVYSVTSVLDDPVAVALAQDSPERSALAEERFDAAYRTAVQQLGVHVNPRFGSWTYPTADGLGMVGDLPSGKQLSTLVGSQATATRATGSTTGSTTGS